MSKYGNLKMNIEVFNKEKVKKRVRMQIFENRKKMQAIVKFFAFKMLSLAKRRCPVDSGRLRGSLNIKFENNGMTAFLNTNVVYAPPQEFITWYNHTVGEWGYMRKSLRDIKKPFTDAIKQALRSG
jgi:hypothetical protein